MCLLTHWVRTWSYCPRLQSLKTNEIRISWKIRRRTKRKKPKKFKKTMRIHYRWLAGLFCNGVASLGLISTLLTRFWAKLPRFVSVCSSTGRSDTKCFCDFELTGRSKTPRFCDFEVTVRSNTLKIFEKQEENNSHSLIYSRRNKKETIHTVI